VPPYAREGATLRLAGDGGTLVVTVCTPRIVRLEIDDGAGPRPSFVPPREWPMAPFEIDGEAPIRLTTSALSLDVATSPSRLTLLDGSLVEVVELPFS